MTTVDSGDAVPAPPMEGAFALRNAPGGALVLTLAPKLPFEVLRTSIRALLADVPARYKGTALRLDLGTRDLELFDLRRLLTLFKEFSVDVVGLHCTPAALHRYAERELKLKIHLSAPPIERAADIHPVGEEAPTVIVTPPTTEPEEAVEEGGGRVLKLMGTVRSGEVVRFGGDVLVFGDVNPGAEIVAGGDIHVFGALKGLACAGARGDDTAIVFALDMRPTQVRIHKVIQIAGGESPDRAGRHAVPEIAWLSHGSIVIEPYRGRHPVKKESSP
jgi:septum site-determining protein MinC